MSPTYKELVLESCKEVKTGTSSKGMDWVLYEVRVGTEKYSTFHDLSEYIGQPITYEVESRRSQVINKKTGKPFVNWTIKAVAGGAEEIKPKPESGAGTEILKSLKELHLKVDDILALLTPPLE